MKGITTRAVHENAQISAGGHIPLYRRPWPRSKIIALKTFIFFAA
jgi:hypothetical protein